MKLFAAPALALALFSAVASAQAPSLDARVDLRIADRTVEDVVSFLRDRSGANIIVLDAQGGEPLAAGRRADAVV